MNPPVPLRRERRVDPDARLRALRQFAARAGVEWVAHEAGALARRAVEGRYYVACVGQFKRGKSTLLNALAGVNVLPTGVTPVTSVVTLLRYGPKLAAVARYADAHEDPVDPRDLAALVSEGGNPRNAKCVTSVEVFVPCALLAGGMCLADTPGLGSVFDANTSVTREFLPHIEQRDADEGVAMSRRRRASDIGGARPFSKACVVMRPRAFVLYGVGRRTLRSADNRVRRRTGSHHSPSAHGMSHGRRICEVPHLW